MRKVFLGVCEREETSKPKSFRWAVA